MNIIDHIYIGILPPLLYTTILDNLTTFAQNETTQHHNRIAQSSSIKPPLIMNIYHEKSAIEPLFNHELLAMTNQKSRKW